MAKSYEELVKELESVKVERDWWKESYFILDSKYQQLSSCHKCVSEEYTQPSKRILRKRKFEEIDNSLMDPLKLPEPCLREILSFLSGKELLTIMEVSKSWKETVQGRKSLMSRAMDEIVVKPTIEDCSLPLINRLLENPIKTGYKNMKTPFVLHRQYTILKEINPIELYSSTLENLTIEKNELTNSLKDDFKMKTCIFPVLRKLNVECCSTFFFGECSFPMLTHLRIKHRFNTINYSELKKLFTKCPQLETFHYDDQIVEDLINENNPANTISESNQPKLKNLYIWSIGMASETFLQDYQNSLVKLEILHAGYVEFFWLVQHLKVLKSLSIFELNEMDEMEEQPFLQNESIEVFKVYDIYFEDEPNRHRVQRFLLALPSVRDMVLQDNDYLTEELIQFLALNMRHLKKLTCKEINQPVKLAYEEIQNNPDQYINSSFELIENPNYDRNEIEKEFI